MEIHSSSLRTAQVPAYRTRTEELDIVKKVQEEGTPRSEKNLNNQSQPDRLTQTPEEIEQVLARENFDLITGRDAFNLNQKPVNYRAKIALDAYTNQLRQPIQSQRNELIAGIDLYI